jgi:hypothetical protein
MLTKHQSEGGKEDKRHDKRICGEHDQLAVVQ